MKYIDKIEFVSLGEFRMGCEGYGIVLSTEYGVIELFKKEIIAVNTQKIENIIEQSQCGQFLLVKGAFEQYMLDIIERKVSLYRTMIRTGDGVVSDEMAILGKERTHINGFTKHYYLQFPFVGFNEFEQTRTHYRTLREKQLNDMINL